MFHGEPDPVPPVLAGQLSAGGGAARRVRPQVSPQGGRGGRLGGLSRGEGRPRRQHHHHQEDRTERRGHQQRDQPEAGAGQLGGAGGGAAAQHPAEQPDHAAAPPRPRPCRPGAPQLSAAARPGRRALPRIPPRPLSAPGAGHLAPVTAALQQSALVQERGGERLQQLGIRRAPPR